MQVRCIHAHTKELSNPHIDRGRHRCKIHDVCSSLVQRRMILHQQIFDHTDHTDESPVWKIFSITDHTDESPVWKIFSILYP